MGANHDEIEQAAAEWLARRDRGRWSTNDDAALARWLAADTAHRVAFLRLQAAWEQGGRLQALGAGWQAGRAPARGHWQATPGSRRDQMLAAISPRAPAAKPARKGAFGLATAAALAGCALLLAWGWRSHTRVDTAAYYTALGEVRTLPLADGSRATLASASGIEVRLSRSARDVALTTGEALFDVAKDKQRPFRVAANGYRAVAVGTRFSVRRDADNLRVVVTEGSVRLEASDADAQAQPSALLHAGSVALVHGDSLLVRSLPLAEARQLLDWRNGLLAFRDAPLLDVAAEFNRYNARKLVVADAAAGALRIGGNFRWDNEEGFVRLLEAGFPVRAEIGTDRIVLRSR